MFGIGFTMWCIVSFPFWKSPYRVKESGLLILLLLVYLTRYFNPILASGDLCRLLITFANSLDLG